MKKRNPHTSGFSLVEVTLALGVVVFCLAAILGLLAYGANSTHVSTIQTSATNILTEVTSDVEATPNLTAIYQTANSPAAKGTIDEYSPIYSIKLPGGGSGIVAALQTIYIGEDGQLVAPAAKASALYQLNVWTTASTSTRQETFVRLLISWPATVPYTGAQGYVENVVAINRT